MRPDGLSNDEASTAVTKFGSRKLSNPREPDATDGLSGVKAREALAGEIRSTKRVETESRHHAPVTTRDPRFAESRPGRDAFLNRISPRPTLSRLDASEGIYAVMRLCGQDFSCTPGLLLPLLLIQNRPPGDDFASVDDALFG